jgi:hypothetical protein
MLEAQDTSLSLFRHVAFPSRICLLCYLSVSASHCLVISASLSVCLIIYLSRSLCLTFTLYQKISVSQYLCLIHMFPLQPFLKLQIFLIAALSHYCTYFSRHVTGSSFPCLRTSLSLSPSLCFSISLPHHLIVARFRLTMHLCLTISLYHRPPFQPLFVSPILLYHDLSVSPSL